MRLSGILLRLNRTFLYILPLSSLAGFRPIKEKDQPLSGPLTVLPATDLFLLHGSMLTRIIQLRIESILRKQRLMVSLLDYISIFHDEYHIGISNR